jgi:hypothetical protein
MDFYFEDFVAQAKKEHYNLIIQVPLGCDKTIIYSTILKYSQTISKHHYLISSSIDEDDRNDNIISYDNLNQKYEENDNTVFFVDNIQIFTFYGSSLLKEFKNSNIFIFFLDVVNVLQKVQKLLEVYKENIEFLYPKQFCVDVNIDYNTKKTILGKEQYTEYQKRFLEYKSLYEVERIESAVPDRLNGILNVYLDKIIPNLSTVSVEYALQRAPKFKTIIVDLLIKNKNRHLVKMIDGFEGIDSFASIYDKLDNTMKMVIIRSKESLSEKMKKIKSINQNNSPITVLTDMNLTGKISPFNISHYHLTDGGDQNDLITIFDLLKKKNFSGMYSKELFVVNHVAQSLRGDFTINTKHEEVFSGSLSDAISSTKAVQKQAFSLFIKGDEMMVADTKI